jgi:hypothetical protein
MKKLELLIFLALGFIVLLLTCTILFFQNRRVVLMTNVELGKLRDVMSTGLVCSVVIVFVPLWNSANHV